MSYYPYDLGAYSRRITTSSKHVQIWFDRGLNWIFGYHHEEAGECFKKILEYEPDCVMAHWGLAYLIGPNYNKPWELFDEQELATTLIDSRKSVAAGLANLQNALPVEQALINALAKRYQSDEPAEDLYVWSADYASAMRHVYHSFPDDPDVATLYAEALMNLTPWKMWDPLTGAPGEGAATIECRELLESAITGYNAGGSRRHPGLLHLYIHLMEMSPTPEAALRAADDLRELVPDAGHLKHMSTHIDVLCGDYQNVVASNTSGIAADLKYYEQAGALNFYSLYRVHNYHFKLYGAMFLGQYNAAMDAVRGVKETIPDELVRMESPPMANWLEGYISMETHALVRFGKWQELIDLAQPADPELYSMTAAINYYGKGVAHAALGNHNAAQRSIEQFENAAAVVSEDKYIHVVSCQQILEIAREILLGETEYHKGNYQLAFEHLRQAVVYEDHLPYDEPWGWMMPSRHALGALLLEQQHVEEAMGHYEADLGLNDTVIRSNQHPDNVWALLGLHDCYKQLGRERDARMIRPRLDFALSRSDINIGASCFCSKSRGHAKEDKI